MLQHAESNKTNIWAAIETDYYIEKAAEARDQFPNRFGHLTSLFQSKETCLNSTDLLKYG